MTLTQLEAFCAVASLGSATAAAERLFLTQPAVSMHVRALERELGAPLLARRGRSLVLTAPGRVLYERSRHALELLHSGKREIASLAAGTSGRLRVGASSTIVLYYLTPLLKAFVRRHGRIGLEIQIHTSEQQVEKILSGQLDLGFAWAPVAREDLEVLPLLRERFVLVSAPQYPLPLTVSPAALRSHPFILAQEGSAMRAFVEDRFRATGIVISASMGFASTEAIKRAVEIGLGVSILASRAVAAERQTGTLRAHRLRGMPFWRTILLVSRRGGALTPLVGILTREAQAYFEALGDPARSARPRRAPTSL